jgi:hypothetical protein
MPNPPSPSNTLTVSHGGDVVVLSDAIRSDLHSISTVSTEVRLQHGVLHGLIEESQLMGMTTHGLPAAVAQARHSMDAALQILARAERRASDIDHAVRLCLAAYAATEGVAEGVWHALSEQVAWSLGLGVRLFGVPLALNAIGSVLATWALTGTSPGELGSDIEKFFMQHPRILASPEGVGVIREGLSDTDQFGEGFLQLPSAVGQLLGKDALGVLGLSASAGVIAGIGSLFGLLKETPVEVKKTATRDGVAAPTTLTERIARFPELDRDANGAQIRIDRYSTPGKPARFDVYIAGTASFDPRATTQPFDFTSDIVGVGQESAGSYRAVIDAMRDAGITSKTPVVLNGYSQGGLIASLVASKGDFDVKGVVTFGAPTGQIPIPADVPVLTVRHAEDLVPATGGYDVNKQAVIVERAVFASEPVPTDLAVPAHHLQYYQATSALADQSKNSELKSVLAPLDRFGAGASSVNTTLWTATRVPAGSRAG